MNHPSLKCALKRIAAILATASIITFLILDCAHSEHHLKHEECKLCAVIAVIKTCLSQTRASSPAQHLFLVLSCLFFSSELFKNSYQNISLIRQKVRLNT